MDQLPLVGVRNAFPWLIASNDATDYRQLPSESVPQKACTTQSAPLLHPSETV